jgi:ABC-type phosphate transport system permease subunit
MASLAAFTTVTGALQLPGMTRQWRLTWASVLTVVAGLLCVAYFVPRESLWVWSERFDSINGATAIALFVFCLLLIQVGLQLFSRFLVNIGVSFIGLDLITSYFGLFGTMALTGLMFVVSGIFLILFGVYLEKKRRKFIQQIKTPAVKEAQ